MITPEGSSADLPLRRPIYIFSRATLDLSLRDAAVQAGARFIPENATRLVPAGRAWAISTPRGEYEVSFLVGADGACSSVRSITAGKYSAGDLSLALGFYLPGLYHRDTALSLFQERGFQGYLWSFPRIDHSSVGILRRLPFANARDLRRRVSEFIVSNYPDAGRDMTFYAARIPCLSRASLKRQRICGRTWALLGDAAGFADAITAEGIYFALRSAELLAKSLLSDDPLEYEAVWRQDFGAELERAAQWRDHFYGGRLLFGSFTTRAVQITGLSSTVQRLTDNLICGADGYDTLRKRLLIHSPRILMEAMRRKLVTGTNLRC
jgi:flavin-dependent dehydrogenase